MDDDPGLDMLPRLTVAVEHGPRGHRGVGSVVAYRGSRWSDVRAALDECLAGCVAAHRVRREKGSWYVGKDMRGPRVVLGPR